MGYADGCTWVAQTDDGRWVAGMTIDGQDYTSGPYDTEEEATAEQRRVMDDIIALAERLGVPVRTGARPDLDAL